MMNVGVLKKSLCETFCAEININPVPVGWAISGLFEDASGDRIGFYLTETTDGVSFEDDGSFLADLVASRIDIEHGQRGELLGSILSSAGAYWDRDTYQIRSSKSYDERSVPSQSIKFLSALLRARDISLLTRDVIKSTFKEDVLSSLDQRYGDSMEIQVNSPLAPEFSDYVSDFVLVNKSSRKKGALYLVNSTEKLLEAQLLTKEIADSESAHDVPVIALIEDLNKVSTSKFKRAMNSDLKTAVYHNEEISSLAKVARLMGVSDKGVTAH